MSGRFGVACCCVISLVSCFAADLRGERHGPGIAKRLCAHRGLSAALVFAREQRNFGKALSRLTPIQASVLRGLADPRHPKLFSGEFMSSNGVRNVGSVTRAVNRLKDEEFVYEFEGEWKFTNPFFREWLLHCT